MHLTFVGTKAEAKSKQVLKFGEMAGRKDVVSEKARTVKS